jgi:hypothetical protein
MKWYLERFLIARSEGEKKKKTRQTSSIFGFKFVSQKNKIIK